jgi:hypothetical protein
MVTKYTQGIPLIKPIDSVDVDFMHQVLVKKQEQYDAGYANTQKMFDEVGNIKLLKESDTQYLNDKINQVSDKINNLGNVDYSDTKFTASLNRDVAGIVKDKRVQNAILDKKNYDQLMERYTKLKENPELYKKYYSDYNYMEDMEQVNKYLTDPREGVRLSINTPTFKVDLEGQIDSKMKDLMKISRQRSDGTMIYTNQGLTESELRAKVRGMVTLDPINQKQFSINAKWKYPDPVALVKNIDEGFTNSIKAIENQICEFQAELLQLGANGDENRKAQLKQGVAELSNQLTYTVDTVRGLKSNTADPAKLKEAYEMMQLENYAVNSFPQSTSMKENKYGILGMNNQYKAAQRGLDYQYDVKLEGVKTQNDLMLLQAKKELGLDADGNPKRKTNGIPNAELLQPTGATAEQAIPQNENKEGLLKNNIASLRNQNKVEFTGLVANMFAEKLGADSPILKMLEAQTTPEGFKEGTLSTVRNTPAFKALEQKVQNDLVSQYIALNKAYSDVLDGKADKYDGWQFTPETQASMNSIQLRSMSAVVAENKLKEAQTKAEAELIKEKYRGNRAAYLADKNRKEELTFIPPTGMNTGAPPVYVSNKAQFNADYNGKLEKHLADSNLYQERPYVINESQLGKERYGAIEGKVNNAMSSKGIYTSYDMTGDPDGYKGVLNGKPVTGKDSGKYKEATGYNVVEVYPSGKAKVEIKGKDGVNLGIGYTRIDPVAMRDVYTQGGLAPKTYDQNLIEYFETNSATPLMISESSPPLFYSIQKMSGGKYDMKIYKDNSEKGMIHLKVGAQDPNQVMLTFKKIINDIMSLPEIQALPKNEKTRDAIYQAITKKFNDRIAK